MKAVPYLSILFALLFITSCDDNDDPEPVNEEEVITTVNIIFTPIDGGDTVTFNFTDLDADGPDTPTISTENLVANTAYEAQIQVLNETESPAEDITVEVAEEDDEHQFFYQFVGAGFSSVTTTYTDSDEDGNPVGINFLLSTSGATTGNLVVTLRHLLDKFGSGVAGGDITNAGGDTDVEATFPIVVE